MRCQLKVVVCAVSSVLLSSISVTCQTLPALTLPPLTLPAFTLPTFTLPAIPGLSGLTPAAPQSPGPTYNAFDNQPQPATIAPFYHAPAPYTGGYAPFPEYTFPGCCECGECPTPAPTECVSTPAPTECECEVATPAPTSCCECGECTTSGTSSSTYVNAKTTSSSTSLYHVSAMTVAAAAVAGVIAMA